MRFAVRSLRFRLLVLATVSTVGALSATYIGLTVIYARQIDRRILAELQQRSLELVGALSSDSAGIPVLDHALSDPRYELPYGGAYWQVSSSDGTPLLRSRSLWDQTLELPSNTSGKPMLAKQPGPANDKLDVLARSVVMPGKKSSPLVVATAFGRKDVDAQGQSFAVDTGVALFVLGLTLLAGVWLQIQVGLNPLNRVRSRLAAVHRGRAQAIEGPFPDEVEPLVSDLNDLFAAQRMQILRAREHAGDLAHALKTPLTIIEGEANRLGQAGNVGSAIVLREQVVAMRRQVDRVLARARVRGLTSAAVVSTSVHATLSRLLAVMVRLPKGDRLEWRNTVDDDIFVDMDVDDLGEVLGNLLDNARKSARSCIEMSASVENGLIRVGISDDGPGMTLQDQAVLKLRGQSGNDAVAGTGLGLAIVSDLLATYATALDFQSDQNGRFCVSFLIGARKEAAKPKGYCRTERPRA